MGRKCCASLLAPVAAIALLVSCSPGDDTVATPTSTTRHPTTSTTQDRVAAEVVARYKGFWQVRLEANAKPVSPDNPKLPEYATGAQLAQSVTEARQRRDQGLALRPADPSVAAHRVKVVRVDTDTAELQDCVTDDDVVYRTSTGEVVDDAVVTRNLTAAMRFVGGVWKLASTRVVQKWEGVAGCAHSSDF